MCLRIWTCAEEEKTEISNKWCCHMYSRQVSEMVLNDCCGKNKK